MNGSFLLPPDIRFKLFQKFAIDTTSSVRESRTAQSIQNAECMLRPLNGARQVGSIGATAHHAVLLSSVSPGRFTLKPSPFEAESALSGPLNSPLADLEMVADGGRWWQNQRIRMYWTWLPDKPKPFPHSRVAASVRAGRAYCLAHGCGGD